MNFFLSIVDLLIGAFVAYQYVGKPSGLGLFLAMFCVSTGVNCLWAAIKETV
jgi:hypothetical protein